MVSNDDIADYGMLLPKIILDDNDNTNNNTTIGVYTLMTLSHLDLRPDGKLSLPYALGATYSQSDECDAS
jgi:hypothetical protein